MCSAVNETLSSIAELEFAAHLTAMSFTLVGAIVALAERSAEHVLFTMATLLFSDAMLLIFVAVLEMAILPAGVLAIAIAGLRSFASAARSPSRALPLRRLTDRIPAALLLLGSDHRERA